MDFRKFALALGGTAVVCLFLIPSRGVGSQGKQQKQGKQAKQGNGRPFPPPESGWREGSIILGNPTDHSIDLAVHPARASKFHIEYGKVRSALESRTPTLVSDGKVAVQTRIEGLEKGSEYSYRLVLEESDGKEGVKGPVNNFWTQRAPGQSFTFLVQGDSHPERNPKMNLPTLYERTLIEAGQIDPDFFICLGDDFSVDTLKEVSPESIENCYLKQVPYLGLVGQTAPIFLVNGNHEQAALVNLDGSDSSLGVRVQNARNRNFCQPAPDSFYSGNETPIEHIGKVRNYFGWTWGDALFLVIDPYWHSKTSVDNAFGKGPKNEGGGKRNRDLWSITLGQEQYDWLKKSLATSRSKYKFVFAHHVSGTGRGGVEMAPFYEWGGKDRNGVEAFAQKRPGWDMPIHQLFVKYGVSVFFQGHDHIFAKQELDGVIYQSCPCPADASNELLNGEAYQTGDKLPGSGLIKVRVEPGQATVEYLRSFTPEAEVDGHKHGEVAYKYTVKGKVQ